MKSVYLLSSLILISIVALVSVGAYTSGNVTFYSPSVNDQQYLVGKTITIDAVVPTQFAGDAATINFFFPNSTLAATIPTSVNGTGGIYVPNAYTFPNVLGIWTITVEVAGGVAVGSINVNVTTPAVAPIILTVQNLAMYENSLPQYIALVNGIVTATVMQNGTVNLIGYVYNTSVAMPLSGASISLTLTIPSVGTKTFTATTASNGSFLISFTVPALSSSISLVSSYLISGSMTVSYGVHTVTYQVLITAIPNYISIINLLSGQVNTLKGEIASLNSTISTLKDEIGTLNGSLSGLSSQISTLNSKIASLNSTISSLESEVSTLNSEYSTLSSTVSTLKSEIATLNGNISTLNSEVSSLEGKVSGLTTIAYGGIIAGIIGLIVAIVAIVLVMRRIS
ncbi:glycosylated S-layer protein, SlaB [Sulfolobus sp. A20]|uniref:glycosylated S-layer protein, SlaB n=1 Tax=Saccharolobus sp. A20 TaxID=1891280 RepID=UPI000845D277|nr:glycosylated S-layer protein, SlaB [Sulfolobus sp. A20]TRM76234.1 glycosylated S-layer protein, SlaB [Sulfolobus sp. B5]TRM77571.1 glycosylated S-layer protein, SlaB [Sulfolobus sp. A20-N-F8]TRM80002.1 glycosylated S-layer protein, SlaB [Sulfolobus sp. D5]TRM83353.1 glycosylated S-layer protein, SlaB [Sulfolobus sp. A20-N-F6]TRM89902.1 glycosylated S-layer protein, SlaB [Sulfolobus sp. C3]TRM93447.1 glycosylated S-layer protein, SlaB [Sulfolobus sp. A20-N-G8]TRN01534.1 glycosylated S-laye